MPNFAKESKSKLHWYVENYPSPHPFFQPAMDALEQKEAEEAALAESSLHWSKTAACCGKVAGIAAILTLAVMIISCLFSIFQTSRL